MGFQGTVPQIKQRLGSEECQHIGTMDPKKLPGRGFGFLAIHHGDRIRMQFSEEAGVPPDVAYVCMYVEYLLFVAPHIWLYIFLKVRC